MKKFLPELLILSLLIGIPMTICSCKHEEGSRKLARRSGFPIETMTETDTPSSSSEPSVSPEPTDTDPTTTTSETLSKGSEITSSFDCEVEVLPPHEVPEYEYKEIKIEDTEILNKDGLSIHIYGYSVGIGTTRSLLMRVDNQTGHPVTLHLERLTVDGYSMVPLWMMDFESGSTKECELEFFQTLGNEIGLWNPGKFEVSFKVEYTDVQETYVSEPATVLTSLYDENYVYEIPYEYTVYDENGIKISVLGYNPPSRSDATLLFLIENHSDQDIQVKTEESLINGIPVNIHLFQMLSPGEKVIATPTIYQSRLDDAKISKVKQIEMILRIQIGSDYKNAILTDPFAVSVE